MRTNQILPPAGASRSLAPESGRIGGYGRRLHLEFVIPSRFQLLGITGRQGDGKHLHVPFGRVWAEQREPGQCADALARLLREPVAFPAHLIPIVLLKEPDGLWNRQVRGDVPRAGPPLLGDETRRARLFRFRAPTDNERLDRMLHFWAHVKKRRALGTA